MNIRTLCTLILLSLTVPPAFGAPDIQQAKKMHQTHCFQCHGAEVYASRGSKLTDKMGLLKRVTGCSRAADTNWNIDQIRLVTEYLNQTYYQFP